MMPTTLSSQVYPSPEKNLVNSALICIAKTQTYKQAYLNFCQETNQMYSHLKTFFDERDSDRHEVEEEAGSLGYRMNTGKLLDDNETTQQFQKTLTNFATNMAKSKTNYSKMVTAASQQSMQMTASLQHMQQGFAQLTQQMVMMTTA